ncbi:MAG: DEAD/DEAH box helicase [Campylobacterales bacterium]|nr:DEAD/DEAH box helicase [Campylobacterales bacterium]
MRFDQLPLPVELVSNLTKLGFHTLKPIQQKALPIILNHQDSVVQAPTASGKTLVFAIASLLKLTQSNNQAQILILAPTRELVAQIAHEIQLVGRYIQNLNITTLIGGESLNAQVQSMQNKTDIIVATVGRLIDHISRGSIAFEGIKMVVIDEADKMLEMGFRDEIVKIASLLPPSRQTLLFSATFAEKLNRLIEQITNERSFIKLDTTEQNIRSIAYQSRDKDQTLLEILSHFQSQSTIIFANTKVEVDRLYLLLSELRFSVLPFHGDFDQSRRDEIFIAFKNGSIAIIVATDIVSRGIDIEGVDAVIHYDIADKPQIHTHRVGRGGRDGSKALSISIYEPHEIKKLEDIAGELEQGNALDTPIVPVTSSMQTIIIEGGKRDKLRKGDIVGALCQEFEIDGVMIGDIELRERRSYIAINKSAAIKIGKIIIKKRNFRLFLMA